MVKRSLRRVCFCWCGRTDQSDLSSDWEAGGSFPIRNGLFNLKNSYDVTVMKHMVHIYKQRARQDVERRIFFSET